MLPHSEKQQELSDKPGDHFFFFWFFVDRLSNMTELDRSPPYNSWTSPSTEIVEYNIFRGFKYQMLWSFVSKAVHFFKAFIDEGIMWHNRRVRLLYEIVRKPHHMWYIESSSGKIQVALSKLGRQRNPDAETVPMERQRTSLGEIEKERNRDHNWKGNYVTCPKMMDGLRTL